MAVVGLVIFQSLIINIWHQSNEQMCCLLNLPLAVCLLLTITIHVVCITHILLLSYRVNVVDCWNDLICQVLISVVMCEKTIL